MENFLFCSWEVCCKKMEKLFKRSIIAGIISHMKLPALFLCTILTCTTLFCAAQQALWEGGKEKMQSAKEKGRQKLSAVRKWKNHIQEWGLDSNYTYALSVGARLHTNGWAGGVYYRTQLSPGRKALWSLHVGEIKHEQEAKQQRTGNTYAGLGEHTPFIYGKVNNAYTVQLAYGREQLLLPALLDGNLSLSIRYAAGPALAFLKPYYLDLVYIDYVPEETAYLRTERYGAGNADKFLQSGAILGSAAWGKGLGEMKYIPGLFAELAFVVEPDKNKSFIQTITIGGNAAFYSSKLEIMAERKAYPYQASFFVGFALGKRWK